MSGAPVLHLDGFDGPLDLLLDLARAQKVDLRAISIGALVDQYLAVLAAARAVRLEVAADWLVMAAWLTWLKSRLLVPEAATPDPDAEAAAAVLTDRLAELDRMRAAAAWLAERDVLGRTVFARGAAETLTVADRSGIAATLPALLRAYAAARRRGTATRAYTPPPRKLLTVAQAVARLERMLAARTGLPGWASLERFLPTELVDPVERRAALAASLIAVLEAARGGALEVRQDHAWGPILLRPALAPPSAKERSAPDARAA